MNQNELKTSYILATILTIVLAIINWRWAVGYVLGAGIAYLLYYRNAEYCKYVLEYQVSSKWRIFSHFFLNYLLMATVLAIGALLPKYVNIFGVALGLFLLKYAVIINIVINRKERKE